MLLFAQPASLPNCGTAPASRAASSGDWGCGLASSPVAWPGTGSGMGAGRQAAAAAALAGRGRGVGWLPAQPHAHARPPRQRLVLAASSFGEGAVPQSAERRRLLHAFTRDVTPALVEQFVERGPPAVVAAMKSTITNMLGTLPPAFFTMRISTVGDNMSQLMASVLMTGYMFRNAQYRLELRNALGGAPMGPASASCPSSGSGSGAPMQRAASAPPQLPSGQQAQQQQHPAGVLDESRYAPGVQKSRVQGDVLLWHHENGVESLPAVAYIELLEGEVARLRQQLGGNGGGTQGPQQPQQPPAAQQQHPGAGAPRALPPPAAAVSQQQPRPGAASSSGGGGGGQASAWRRNLPVPASPSALLAAQPPGSAGARAGPGGGALVLEEPGSELLDYLRCLDAASMAELTGGASAEVSAAMDTFVARLMGTGDRDSLARAGSECTSSELARLMLWLLVVGYTLRGMEVRFELARSSSSAGSGAKQQLAGLSVKDSHETW